MSNSLLLHKPIVQKLIDVYTEEKFDEFPKDFLTFLNLIDEIKTNKTEENKESIFSQAAFLRELIYWELRFYIERDKRRYYYMHDVDCSKLKLEAVEIVVNELVNLGFKLYIILVDGSKYICKPPEPVKFPNWMEIATIGIANLKKVFPKNEQTSPIISSCSLIDQLVKLYSSNFTKFPDDIVDIFDNREHLKNISAKNLLRHQIYLTHKFYRNFVEIDIDVSLPDEEVYLVTRELLELGLTLKLESVYHEDMIITLKDFDKIINTVLISSLTILSLTN